MRRSARALALLFPSLLGAGGLPAQSPTLSLGLGSATLPAPRTAASGLLTAVPSLRLDLPGASLEADALLLRSFAGDRHATGRVDATFFSPSRHGLRLEGGVSGARTDLPGAPRGGEATAAARLSLQRGAGGAWLGGTIGGVWGALPSPLVTGLSAGSWRQRGSLTVTTSLAATHFRANASPMHARDLSRSDSIGVVPAEWSGGDTSGTETDSLSALDSRFLADARLGLHWLRGPVSMELELGTRFRARGAPETLFGGGRATIILSRQLALVAAAGTAPDDPSRGIERGTHAALGIRILGLRGARARAPAGVRPTTAEFGLRPGAHGAYVVRVRVPGARTVELVGDFTGWKPVAMAPVSTDEWETTIAIAPGVHRLNLRVDGDGWRAPPGIETVEDEFNGEVGVIVVE